MSKLVMGTIAFLSTLLVATIIMLAMYFSYNNAEMRLRNQIAAKQVDNTSQLDNTIKTISQNAQVTDAQKNALREIIVGNSEAFAKAGGGSLATAVTQAVPNMDQTTQTYRQLMNTITAARETWTRNQTQLLDLKREHDNVIDLYPSHIFVSLIGGKQKINVVIVTSTRTGDSFRTGKDDDTTVFTAPSASPRIEK